MEAKNNGIKIVGYFPGGYVPEELIYASGAIPLGLAEGGSNDPVDASLSVMPQCMCPFARAQVGERLLKNNPYYSLVDMLIAPITCQHLKKVAEIWEYYHDLEIFKLGIPHQYDGDPELEYYTDRLRALKDRLQAFTGNSVTDEKLGEAITLYNRMKGSLKKLSLLRRRSPSPLSTLDFVKLNHASFYADPAFMADTLDSVYHKLRKSRPSGANGTPRLLLVAPSLACGDYRVLELIEAAGGNIVIEEVCEGIRYYWQEINNEGDLLDALARGYLRERLPCAFMRYSARKRLDFTLKMIKEFNVDGVIWYELLYCEAYDSELYLFAQELKSRNIPMHTLELDYGMIGSGQVKTRVDAFVELVKGGPG